MAYCYRSAQAGSSDGVRRAIHAYGDLRELVEPNMTSVRNVNSLMALLARLSATMLDRDLEELQCNSELTELEKAARISTFTCKNEMDDCSAARNG